MSHCMKSSFLLIFLLNIHINVALLSTNRSDEYLGSTGKHLFHFVQVTDIHVTHLGDRDRMEQFEEFCNEIIKRLVKPKVTIVSGDLVNNVGGSISDSSRLFNTKQYEEEWKMYQDILNRTNVTKYTKWLDIKGNHDVFMDSDPDSSKSFYRIYSHQGHAHQGSYEYTLRTRDNDTYSFIGVDMCPRPGIGGPFNFYGRLNQKEKQSLINISERTKNSTSIIFFGHYPLSFTYSSGLDQIMKHALIYLNGHLHSGIKHLYARHSNGLLELELGDWKRKRRFRIVTIDSGLLSFEDFRFSQPIYAVISNPKSATFHTPREPFHRLNESTHIRIVIFSKLPIVNVNISIDGKYLGMATQSIDNRNLFVLPWNTSLYRDENLHEISVEIKDKGNNTVTLQHQFSLSLSMLTKWNYPKILLTIHQPTFGFLLVSFSLIAYILVLSYYRYQAKHHQFNPTSRFLLWNRFRLRMTLLCSVDLMFYPLIGFALYHFIGPWYIGYLTEGYFGAIFLWGIFVRGVYLQPDSQVIFATIQLYFIIFPMTFSLSSSCFYRYNQLENMIKSRVNWCFRIYSVYILYVYAFILFLFWTYVMSASYKFSWIISPFGLFLPICSMVLFIKSHRLKSKDFKLKIPVKINELIDLNNEDNSKLLNPVNQNLHLMKSQ